MALNYKKQKNLIRSPDEYTRYYGDFRGVDFSSDHTEVHEQRLAYSINMYKDYRTGEGNAIETVPGFRKRFVAPRTVASDGKYTFDKINGIHEFSYVKADGTRDKDVLVHAGQYLYLWDNYPDSVNVLQEYTFQLLNEIDVGKEFYKIVEIQMGDAIYNAGFYQIGTSLILEANFGDYRGETLYVYYYNSVDAEMHDDISVSVVEVESETVLTATIPIESAEYITIENQPGELKGYEITPHNGQYQIKFTGDYWAYYGQNINLHYYDKTLTHTDAIKDSAGATFVMNDAESKSFAFNNRLYIIDGTQFIVYYKNKDDSGFTLERVDESVGNYVPTTYRNLGVGAIAPEDMSKYEYEQKNLLCANFKHTYVAGKDADEEWVSEYPLYDDAEVIDVTVNGVSMTKGEDYTVDTDKSIIKFTTAPTIPDDKPETYAGVVITFAKKEKTDSTGSVIYSADLDKAKINKCTICATFDKRVFLTGNPDYPNHIWYCGYNNLTGYEDAAYFGELDYVIDGVENAPITGLIPVGDTLAAIKNHTRQDGSVYFHTRLETNTGVIPVTYPSEPGLSGIGCLGACVNFLDDPIFISRLGVEGISKLNLKSERSVEHRSSLIDAKLVNLDLEKAHLAEWDGYLVVLVDGKIFLADSRQKYAHTTGVAQYEWYYLEDIGIYEGQYTEYYYAPVKYDYIPDIITADDGKQYNTDLATHIYDVAYTRSENLLYTPVKDDFGDSDASKDVFSVEVVDEATGTPYTAYFVIKDTWDGTSYNNGTPDIQTKAILCEDYGSYTGGEFYPAEKVVNIDENIFFGTDNGIVCSFNFDKKNADGTISPKYYTFNERTIYCGIATKMDNCGIPHLTKSTIKKSTVIKTKSMIKSAAKVRVRTNNKGYESVSRVNSRVFSFDNVDFSDFSFVSTDQTIFAVKEKEKHWVEKQHWIYSDEFQCPFSVHYLAFRYKVSGRIKG